MMNCQHFIWKKESLITVIVDAEKSAVVVKRVWEDIQSQCQQQMNHSFKESGNTNDYTVQVEALLGAANQSGTIVCGDGQLSIEVVEVLKRLPNESGHGSKNIPEGEKGWLLSSMAKKEHIPSHETYQSNAHTRELTSKAATVNNEGSSWGTPWSANNTIILKVQIQIITSHDIQPYHRNDFKILSVKASDSIIPKEN